jgi:putative membrane protein
LIFEVVSVFLGVFCGVFTGLVPGLHLNSFIPFLLGVPGLTGFVVGVTVSHSFFDFFPAAFLGVPEESTALYVLPAHRMVLRGRALEAVHSSIHGSLFSSLFLMAFLPSLTFCTGFLVFLVLPFLLLTCLFMVFSSKKKLLTFMVFLVAGFIGLKNISSPNAIMAMLSGFFGASTLIFSLLNQPFIPKQKNRESRLPPVKPLFFGCLSGIFSGLLPGVSSSVSGLVAKHLGRVKNQDFVTVLGGTNTVYALTAIMALDLIGKPRSGAALLIGEIPGLFFLVGSALIALGVSAFLALGLSGFLVKAFESVPVQKLNLASLFFLCVLAVHFQVFFLFLVCTALGLLCVFSGVKKSTCMASLLLPVIVYYAS